MYPKIVLLTLRTRFYYNMVRFAPELALTMDLATSLDQSMTSSEIHIHSMLLINFMHW